MSTYTHTFRSMTLDEIDRVIDDCGEMVREISRSQGWIEVEFPSEADYHEYNNRPTDGD